MNIPFPPPPPGPFPTKLEETLQKAERRISEAGRRLQNRIRQKPAESVAAAAAVGFLFNRLPVRAILYTNIKVIGAMAPPALMMLGAFKLAEYLKRKDESFRSRLRSPLTTVPATVPAPAVSPDPVTPVL